MEKVSVTEYSPGQKEVRPYWEAFLPPHSGGEGEGGGEEEAKNKPTLCNTCAPTFLHSVYTLMYVAYKHTHSRQCTE